MRSPASASPELDATSGRGYNSRLIGTRLEPSFSVYAFLLVLLVLDAALLITVVLLQAGTGGGLAAVGGGGGGGSSDSLFGSRQAVTFLTKTTWWTGGLFLVISFTLSVLASRPAQSESILKSGLQPAAPISTPALPQTTPQTAPAGGATPAPAPQAP